MPPTLVFDEIDAGIGGHTARAVAHAAARAGRRAPGPCDHPSERLVASVASRHFTIAKESAGRLHAHDGHAPWTRDGVVGELVRMLGADDRDAGARRHAKELLAAA